MIFRERGEEEEEKENDEEEVNLLTFSCPALVRGRRRRLLPTVRTTLCCSTAYVGS